MDFNNLRFSILSPGIKLSFRASLLQSPDATEETKSDVTQDGVLYDINYYLVDNTMEVNPFVLVNSNPKIHKPTSFKLFILLMSPVSMAVTYL